MKIDANSAAGASADTKVVPQQIERLLNLFQYNNVTAKYSGEGCQCDDNNCHLDEGSHKFCSGTSIFTPCEHCDVISILHLIQV